MSDLPPVGSEVDASIPPVGAEVDAPAPAPQDVFDLPRKAALTKWATEVGSRVSPEQNAEVLRIGAARPDLDPQFIHDHLDAIRQEVAGTDYEALARQHPILSEFMQNPERAGLVKDDVANLGRLEWALTGRWGQSVSEPGEKNAYGQELPPGTVKTEMVTPPVWGAVLRDAFLKSELALRQSGTFLRTVTSSGQPGTEADLLADSERVAELKAKVGQAKDYGSDSAGFKAFEFIADLVPMIGGTVASAAAGGAVAGPAGAVIAPLAFNFMLGVGPDYAQRREVLKASGKTGDPDAEEAALAWSGGVGWVNSMLMTAGLGPAFKGVARKVGLDAVEKGGAKAVEKILADETVGQVLKRAGIEYGKDYAQGLAAIQAMTLVSSLSQEKFRADQMGDDFHWEEVGRAQAESFKDSLLPMAILGGVSLPVRKYTTEVGRAMEIDRAAKRLQTAVDLAKQTKAADIAPAEVQSLLGQMANGETLHLEKAEFDRLYQEKGVDPRAVAAKAMGDDGKAYDAAAATGEIAVPAEVFLTQLARTADSAALIDMARFSGQERNPRQAKLVLVETGKKLKAQADAAKAAGRKAPIDEIREDFAKKAAEAGRSRLESESTAEIVARSYAWFGAESGVDPVDLYRRDFVLNIAKGGEKAAGDLAQEPSIEGLPVRVETFGKVGGERAYIRMSVDAEGKKVQGDIHVLSADPSSLPHELTHFFKEVMRRLSQREGAGQGIKDAWATVLKDMGYESDASYEAATAERKALAAKDKRTPQENARLKLLVGREERLTHGFEQFLAEGKAPSAELLPVFARFKTWMARVYKGVEGVEKQYRDQYGMELNLTDEVRNVFRKMLAGEQAVADAARDSYQAMPLVALTPEEQAQSDKLRAESIARAEAGIRKLIATEERAADKAYMKVERTRVENEVRADMEKNSVYAAIDALSGASEGSPGPIDRAALVKQYGAAVADAMPKGTVAKDGLPPDVAADFVGFTTTEEMVRALVAAPPRDQFIRREVARRMREQFPTLLERPALLADMAKVELENDPAIRDGIIRLRALAREAGIDAGRLPSAKELRDAADLFVEDVAYSDLRVDRFENAGKAAVRRMSETADPKRRLDEFETYLFNRALVRAASEAKVEAEKAAAVALKYTTDTYRAKLGKAVEHVTQPDGTVVVEQPYLKAMDDLLAAFEFRPSVSMKEVRGRDSAKAIIEAFVAQRRAQGDDVVIPESVWKRLDRQTSWKELSLYELRDLRSSVESIAKQAERQSTFDLGNEKLATEKVIAELVAGTLNGLKKTVDNPLGGEHLQTLRAKIDKGLRLGVHSVERPELVLRALDHGKDDGPWHRYYWNKISDASYRYYDLARETSGAVQKMLRELPAADRARLRDTRFTVDGSEYTLENAIVVAANAGNESNWSKMIRGMSDPRLALYGKVPWQGEATARRILSHLTQKDVDLVNAIHKSTEHNWSATEALEKEMTGLAPPKVQARPFKFKGEGGVDLVIDGGYYPLIYSDLFKVGKNQREADSIAANGLPGLFSPGYSRAMTPQGHTEARVEQFARPLDLTLDALPRKLVMTAKDIAFRKDAIQLYRVLTDERVQGALTQAVGKDGADLLVAHLRDSVNDVMLPDSGAGWILRSINKIRGVTTEAIFGLNVPQTLQNLADFTGVSAEVPTKYVMAASLKHMKDRAGTVAQVTAESPEMRLRFDRQRDSLTAQMEETFRKSALRVKWADAKEVMMAPFEASNHAVEVPVYLGAKEHALAQGKSEAEAIRHAQDVVRSLFGGKRTIDLPPIMRDKVLRHFTMFYGWANAQLNLFMKSTQTAGAEWDQGRRAAAVKALSKVYATLWAKNVASELLVGKAAEDYNEDGTIGPDDIGRWVAYRGVMTLPLSAPFLGSMVRGMEGKQSRDVSFTPWLNVANAAVRAGKAVGSVGSDMTDEDAANLFLAWMEAGGMAVGAPVSQVRSTAKYWMGREPGAGPGEDVLGTVYGPSRPGKLSDALFGGGR